ncbi:hypothetical protein GCM10023081_36400 [Arthrobacter ginkgonis]|uniref:Solute-binding protein family 5 domain-containing protein n=1 Tax=Arthrobacter ginkgonis TaxID=1630594 RepID=A0ABP7CWG3_9MICC
MIGTRLMAETLDPQQASNATNEFYNAPVYNTLVTFNAQGELAPELAVEWEIAKDAKSLTLKLRDGVTFHSGNPFTADDVVYTLERAKKVGTGVAAFIAGVESATAQDDSTVTIKLRETNLDAINALSMVYILDSALVKQHEGNDNAQQWLANNDAGSGAFAMKAFKPSQQVSLARFDGYWEPLAGRPSVLEMRMIPEASAVRDELQAGGIDIGYEIAAADKPLFESSDKYQVVTIPGPIQTYVNLNMKGKWTSDPRVREALQLSYDYQGHLDTILHGRGKFATGLASDTVRCRAELPALHQDLERAKSLIKEAGAEGATLTLAYQTGPVEHNMAGTVLQSSLREIGLNVEIKNVTFPQYLEMLSSPETVPDLGIAWDFAAYPSVGPMLQRAWHSSAIGQTNASQYSNAQVDALLDASAESVDAQQACDDLVEAQKLIAADRPTLYVANRAIQIIADKRVTGIQFMPTSQVFDASLIELAK